MAVPGECFRCGTSVAPHRGAFTGKALTTCVELGGPSHSTWNAVIEGATYLRQYGLHIGPVQRSPLFRGVDRRKRPEEYADFFVVIACPEHRPLMERVIIALTRLGLPNTLIEAMHEHGEGHPEVRMALDALYAEAMLLRSRDR